MLEMILNSEHGKLSERVTKFLIYQVSAFIQTVSIHLHLATRRLVWQSTINAYFFAHRFW